MPVVHLTWLKCVCRFVPLDSLREGFPSAKNMTAHLMWASSQTPWSGVVKAVRDSGPLSGGTQHSHSAKVSGSHFLYKLASSELHVLHTP